MAGITVAGIIWTQIAISALGCLLMFLLNTAQNTIAFALGAVFASVNLIYFAWIFVVLIRKKLIALGLALIVIKYALLFGTILYLLKIQTLNWGWIVAGIGTIMPTVLVTAAVLTFSKDREITEEKK